jgi:hypothetical protein
MTIKENKKKVRYDSIHKYFKKMNPDVAVYDTYQAYILDLIVNLGEIYDDNHETIRQFVRAGKEKDREARKFYDREDHLNLIGKILRRSLGMDVRENLSHYQKAPMSATEIKNI